MCWHCVRCEHPRHWRPHTVLPACMLVRRSDCGARATSSNPLCQPGLTVPWDTDCPFSKSNGETCTSTWCERNYGWVTLKIECSDKRCHHNDLTPPTTATIIDDARCPVGNVPHGGLCTWQQNTCRCASAICVEGLWIPAAPQCAAQGCAYDELQLPTGAAPFPMCGSLIGSLARRRRTTYTGVSSGIIHRWRIALCI